MRPAFSIVTVCFNAAESLEETLKSVFCQTCQDFEYIIIDGASRDGTTGIIESYRDRFSVVVSEPDNGLYDAMNKAIERVSGSFVLFLNAGDLLSNEHVLEKVRDAATKHDYASLIYGDYTVCSERGIKYIDCKNALAGLKRDFYFCHQAIFFGRDYLENFDLRYRIKADYDLVIRHIGAAGVDSVVYCPFSIVDYALEGFSSAYFWLNLKEGIILHYRRWGLIRVFLNSPVYLKRFLRSLKENFLK